MKNIILLTFLLTSLFAQYEIEGRWHLVDYEDNVMYQFEDSYRYSIYSTDGNFGSLEDAGGTPNPYIVEEDIITIDLFFGNVVNYLMNYICDGRVVEFIDDGNIHSILFKEGYNYINNECQEYGDINDDGQINVIDIVLLVSYILDGLLNDNGDVNQDNLLNVIDVVLLVNIILIQDNVAIYSNNPYMNGQFLDAILINRNPDCRAYTMDENDGDYGSSLILDISNGIDNAISDVHIDLVIANNWDPNNFDYVNVTEVNNPELATHCRMISNMIPSHDFGVEVTGPNGDGWIHAIDHSDIEVTYIPVNPIKTNVYTDTPRNPPIYNFEGILLNGVGISMNSGFCYNPGVETGPNHLQSNEAGNTSGCGPQNSWFELPAYTIWNPNAEYMSGIFDSYFGHGYEGTYHYHALTHPLQEDSDQSQPPSNGDGSPVIGFAADGFPIYGHWFIDSNNQLVRAESGYETYNSNSRTPIETALHGTPPTPWDIENNPDHFESNFGLEMGRYEEDWYFAGTGNLDECNGAYDVNGDYGYYITDKYPFTPPCTFGVRNPSFGKESPTIP